MNWTKIIHPLFFRTDGTFIKKDKSILMQALEKNISEESREIPRCAEAREICLLYDGMALIHARLRKLNEAKTVGEIADKLFTKVLHPHYLEHITNLDHLRIDVVMDTYPEFSIKGQEQEHRKSRRSRCYISCPNNHYW